MKTSIELEDLKTTMDNLVKIFIRRGNYAGKLDLKNNSPINVLQLNITDKGRNVGELVVSYLYDKEEFAIVQLKKTDGTILEQIGESRGTISSNGYLEKLTIPEFILEVNHTDTVINAFNYCNILRGLVKKNDAIRNEEKWKIAYNSIKSVLHTSLELGLVFNADEEVTDILETQDNIAYFVASALAFSKIKRENENARRFIYD